ncbi:MAG: hypothetical protein GY909_16235 [Oligoflexia bacterium]|nr:hypothetical protein [Oligoflexia bacterium]
MVSDLLAYIDSFEIEHTNVNHRGWIDFEECPNCSKRRKFSVLIDSSKETKLSLKSGRFQCYSCGVKGNFYNLASIIEEISLEEALLKYKGKKKNSIPKKKTIEISTSIHEGDDLNKLSQILNASETELPWNIKDLAIGSSAYKYLLDRGLSPEDIYKLGPYDIPNHNHQERLRLIAQKLFKDLELVKREFKNKQSAVYAIYSRLSLLEGRILFPAIMGSKCFGYIARAYTDDFFGPKVVNSKGALTSNVLFNFNNVKNAQEIVLVEGIFDAATCGLDRTIPLLSSNISKYQPRFELLKLLAPKKIKLFLDPGARDKINQIGEILSEICEVEIVLSPNKINLDLIDPVGMSILKRLEINGDLIAPNTLKVLKILTKQEDSFYNLSLKDQIKFITKRYRNLDRDHLTIAKEIVSKIDKKELLKADFSKIDYLDANDLGKKEVEAIIENSIPFNSNFDYKIYDKIKSVT